MDRVKDGLYLRGSLDSPYYFFFFASVFNGKVQFKNRPVVLKHNEGSKESVVWFDKSLPNWKYYHSAPDELLRWSK
jgi:hypothetical protein